MPAHVLTLMGGIEFTIRLSDKDNLLSRFEEWGIAYTNLAPLRDAYRVQFPVGTLMTVDKVRKGCYYFKLPNGPECFMLRFPHEKRPFRTLQPFQIQLPYVIIHHIPPEFLSREQRARCKSNFQGELKHGRVTEEYRQEMREYIACIDSIDQDEGKDADDAGIGQAV